MGQPPCPAPETPPARSRPEHTIRVSTTSLLHRASSRSTYHHLFYDRNRLSFRFRFADGFPVVSRCARSVGGKEADSGDTVCRHDEFWRPGVRRVSASSRRGRSSHPLQADVPTPPDDETAGARPRSVRSIANHPDGRPSARTTCRPGAPRSGSDRRFVQTSSTCPPEGQKASQCHRAQERATNGQRRHKAGQPADETGNRRGWSVIKNGRSR